MSAQPYYRILQEDIPAVAAASSDSKLVAKAPNDLAIQRVTYAPKTTMTGQATNNRQIRLINRGQDGNGTTVLASLSFGAGTNAAAKVERTIPLVGSPVVTGGDLLDLESNAVGTGIADPGGRVFVEVASV